MWNTLLARHPASVVVPFTLLVPVSGIATAWLARGERPTSGTALGGVLLMVGVAVTVVRLRRRPRPVAEDVGLVSKLPRGVPALHVGCEDR